MIQNVSTFFKRKGKKEQTEKSKNAAKERLHLVLMQDRAHVSADFLDLMKQEIVDVIKKYIDVDENEMDVKLTNKSNEDGTSGAPALFANIPIMAIKEEAKKENLDVVNEKMNETEATSKNEDEVEKIVKGTKATAKKTVSAKKSTTKTTKAATKTAKKATTKVAKKTKKAEEVEDVKEVTEKEAKATTKTTTAKKKTTKKVTSTKK